MLVFPGLQQTDMEANGMSRRNTTSGYHNSDKMAPTDRFVFALSGSLAREAARGLVLRTWVGTTILLGEAAAWPGICPACCKDVLKSSSLAEGKEDSALCGNSQECTAVPTRVCRSKMLVIRDVSTNRKGTMSGTRAASKRAASSRREYSLCQHHSLHSRSK